MDMSGRREVADVNADSREKETDSTLLRPEQLKARAALVLQQAAVMRSTRLRQQLHQIASDYEVLAEMLETAQRKGYETA
jgi:hypothetical protein